jgi:hypothetical protein
MFQFHFLSLPPYFLFQTRSLLSVVVPVNFLTASVPEGQMGKREKELGHDLLPPFFLPRKQKPIA